MRLPALVAALVLAGACAPADPEAGAQLTDAGTPSELRPLVEELVPRLERLSGLDREETLRVRRQTRAEARAYVEQRLEKEMPAELREGVRRTYAALGLIPDTLDLDALLLDLYTEQVLGYYDPGTRTLYVVEGADPESLRPVLAHELVHALQDQHTDLDSIVGRERGNDRQSAAHAAMEGHAMVVMFAVLAEQAAGATVDPAELASPAVALGPALAAQNEQFPVFRRAPRIIQETLLFPYLGGAEFVHSVWTAISPQQRYPAPIDSLLPQSTEQVLRPLERFVQHRDAPTELRFDALPGRMVYENTLGQLETGILLEQHLGAAARAYADGWDGDRYVLVSDEAGRDVLHWTSVWDSDAAADAFAAAFERAATLRPRRAVTIERIQVDGMPGVNVTDAPAGGPPVAARPAARVTVQ
ncbi:MAG: hypothetical protein WD054_00605 [Gemmatimonadota bacterium]